MDQFVIQAKKIIFAILGIQRILNHWDKEPWLVIVICVCIALTITWMVRMWKGQVGSNLGKTIGGLAIGFIMLGIGLAVMMALVGWVLGLATGAFLGSVSKIWIIGPPLAKAFGWIINAIAGFVMGIAILIYVIRSFMSVVEKAKGVVEGGAKAWAGDGPNGVKWGYVLAGSFIIAAMICHPEWNYKLYFIPAGLSAAFGIFSLIWTTAKGQRLMDYTGARALGRPMADGNWICPNFGRRLVTKWWRFWQRTKEQVVYCRHLNPATAEFCMSTICDYPRTYAQKCVKCGYNGDNGKGFPREPDKHVKCPKCYHTHAPLPKSMGFHPPDQDRHHADAPSTPAPTAVLAPVPADNVRCAHRVRVLGPDNAPLQERDANGQPVFVTKDGKKRAKVQMKVCGTVYPKTAATCPACKKPNPLVVPPAPPPEFALPDLEAECPHCGAKYLKHIGLKYCMECVRELAAPPEPVGKAVEEEPEEDLATMWVTDEEAWNRTT